MKPILKWAGGKSRLAPQICEAFSVPCEDTYYEPFVGSAAVFLHRRAHGRVGRAVLSDVNVKLMNFHRAIRDNVAEVIRELGRLPTDDWRERYYEVREAYNRGPWDGPAHAARFVWLNRAGYNGLYRENRDGELNVPLGKYSHVKLPEPAAFSRVSQLMQGVELLDGGFAPVLEWVRPGDQVYCDPPYVPLSATSNFTAYSREPFGPEEQRRLSHLAQKAARRGARVVLSNHDVPFVRNELYAPSRGFEMVFNLQVSRAISRKAEDRHAVGEVIAAIGPMVRAA